MARLRCILRRRWEIALALTTGVFCAAVSAAGPSPEVTSTVAQLVERARVFNPELRAAESRWEASRARVPQAGSLDDPQLRLMWMNVGGNPAMSVNPNDMQYRLGVTIPFPGKRALKAEIAQKDADISEEEIRRVEAETIRRVKAAYYDVYLAEKKMTVNAGNVERIRGLLDVVRERYAQGQAPLYDVLALQNDLAIRVNNDATYRDEKRAALARLNAVLDRAPTTSVPVDDVVNDGLFEWRRTAEELTSLASENRPELRQSAISLEQGEAAVRLSYAQYKPDFMLMLDRQPGQTPLGGFDAMVTINLPFVFRKKYDFGLAEAKANVEAAESVQVAMRNSIAAEVETTLASLDAARRSALLARDVLIPQSEDAYEAAVTGYLSGTVDFVRLGNALINVEQMRLGFYEASTTYLKQIAEMERVVGLELQ